MSLFRKIKEPTFLKTSDSIKEELDYVTDLWKKTKNNELNSKINSLKNNFRNETNINNELRNSHIPMYILQDLNLEYLGFKGKIDYIVITKNNCYVILMNNLYGDIRIDCNDNFIRTTKIDNKIIEENIESPVKIINNQIELLKVLGYYNKKTLDKIVYDKLFYKYCKPIILIGDYNAKINDCYASNNVKNQMVLIDNLIKHIIINDLASDNKFSNRAMYKTAENILNNHQKEFICYDIVYKDYMVNNNDNNLLKALKKYRYYLSKKEAKPIYLIFDDKVINELIESRPSTIEELSKIKGFSKTKKDKYGSKILEIINKN